MDYCDDYEAYLARHAGAMPEGMEPFAPYPRVVMIPGLGVFCAGPDLRDSVIARDITEHTLAVKASILAGDSPYKGLPEAELFRMEYRTLQHAKLRTGGGLPAAAASEAQRAHTPLRGHVALVTGAAGAIGTGICQGLLGGRVPGGRHRSGRGSPGRSGARPGERISRQDHRGAAGRDRPDLGLGGLRLRWPAPGAASIWSSPTPAWPWWPRSPISPSSATASSSR